jgi:hypothetical protein
MVYGTQRVSERRTPGTIPSTRSGQSILIGKDPGMTTLSSANANFRLHAGWMSPYLLCVGATCRCRIAFDPRHQYRPRHNDLQLPENSVKVLHNLAECGWRSHSAEGRRNSAAQVQFLCLADGCVNYAGCSQENAARQVPILR